jgi:glycosyltransferase involved in cell wall biosynthesis
MELPSKSPEKRPDKPRVLLLVTLSEIGGAQQVTYSLARHLSDEYEITVACAPNGALVERLRRDGIHVVEIPDLVRNVRPWRDLRAFFSLRRWLRRERFDLVHTHSTKAGLLGRLAARYAGVPGVLFTAHGWAFTEGRAYWVRRLLARVERYAARRTSKIICVSEHDRELALRFRVADPQQLVVIHNGIDPGPFREADGKAVRAEWGIDRDEPLITFVGRLAAQKDPLTLLEAVRRLSGGRVLLVGGGPLRSRVRAFLRQHGLEDRVVLTGEQTNIPEILAASDIFVLPSRWEGLPLTVIEAMLAGLPVVAGRVGGVPELVEEGVTGLLVPPGDPTRLAEALQRLLDGADLRHRMGDAARRRALRRFTLESMLRKYRDVYAEVLATTGVRYPLIAQGEAESFF